MRASRVVALVVGVLVLISGFGLLFTGGALGLGYAFGRSDDGYFESTIERLSTDTVAVTTEDIELDADPDSADWVFDRLDANVRLRVTSVDPDRDVFIGIARQQDVAAFLEGVAHDEIVDLENGDPVYERRSGSDAVGVPTEQTFWDASASGPGVQELTWEPASGRWAVVLMNADGTPGVISEVNIGAKSGLVLPLAIILGVIGALLTALAIGLIIFGARGARREASTPGAPPLAPPQ